MFGYIAPRLDQLPEDRQKRYRACYCGLCKALHQQSGHSGRITLSNDMTFLAMLLSSLYEPEETEKSLRCPVHPFKKRELFLSEMTVYAADMNLLLTYYKFQDKVIDEHSSLGSLGMKKLRPSLDRIEKEHPVQARGVREALETLWEEEKSASPNPDTLCNLSGVMLGSVFSPKEDHFWAPELYALGEGLGRFVYWMDAWEDLDGDLKHGRFNPLSVYRNREDFDSFCRDTLTMLIGEATEHFEVLPLEKDLDILRNVLYSGVWQRYYALLNRKNKEKPDE